MIFYILRKHPRYPYGGWDGSAHIAAFTIHDVSTNKAMLQRIAKEKNKRSRYLWTVGKLTVKETL